MTDRPDVEVLGQGREPDAPGPNEPVERFSVSQRLPLGARRVAGLVLGVAALVIGGTWYAGRPDIPAGHGAGLAPSPSQVVLAPQPDPLGTTLVPGRALSADLVAPRDDVLDSFIASAGHVLLFVRVSNVGSRALRVIDGTVPQSDTSRDLADGGQAAGTSNGLPIQPGQTTEVYLRIAVDCDHMLPDSVPANRLLLMVQGAGSVRQLESVPGDGIGPLWGEARTAACYPVPPASAVSVQVLARTVMALARVDGAVTVHTTIALHNAAGTAAVVTLGDQRAFITGGSSVEVGVTWPTRCDDAAMNIPVTLPMFTELGSTNAAGWADLGAGFGALWTTAVTVACRNPS
jgi:hypothetical protein